MGQLSVRADGDLQEVSTPVGSSWVNHNPDSVINGLLVASDRLIDISTDSRLGLTSQQPYFCQVIAPAAITVGGVALRINFTAFQYDNNYNNAIALFDLSGNRLAVGNAGPNYRDYSGWNRIAFDAPYTLVAGMRYLIGIIVDGNSPGFNTANGHSEINARIPSGSLPRTFRKSNVPNFAAASLDLTTGIMANAGERLFLSLVA
ncbi:hypothetical protein M0L20_13680 [Spirosoma sp. RP8]|uniref:DUF4082 domain-containing protein n=1 Tax=Spirosoma liriopis TaxID=2937440 RepID=A0ABT0HL81_9BACT|nr:hypothetical protein [Spirosoma liriopis]MCK8492913.1 hypothetical protein [Spirosoma liriopis]